MNNQAFTLFELNNVIKQTLYAQFDEAYWLVAEISNLNSAHNGHCYLELIEKNNNNEQVVARMRATIWASKFALIRSYFEAETGQSLSAGLKVLVRASVEFSEVYGISLNIIDIEPSYTLGDMAQRRKQILAQLESEGIINMNKELELPYVPQRIAIISSESAAGYEDFMEQLLGNSKGYKFYTKLFNSKMQGSATESSVCAALESIMRYEELFDVVVIIRGGGSTTDLMAFDNYNIASYIAQFPIPVITGIGHDRDKSVCDIVAHTSLKTPTAVASYVLDEAINFENELSNVAVGLVNTVKDLLKDEREDLIDLIYRLKPTESILRIEKVSELDAIKQNLLLSTKNVLSSRKESINNLNSNIKYVLRGSSVQQYREIQSILNHFEFTVKTIKSQNNIKVDNLFDKLRLLDPKSMLKRGYSLTYVDGKLIKRRNDISNGDIITTKFIDGEVQSKVDM